jgi:hypothetical protein
VEDDFLAHLSAGQVLYEGRWVNFAEAKKIRPPTPARRSGTKTKKRAEPDREAAIADTAVIAEAPPAAEETLIGQSSAIPSGIAGEAVPFPPETSVIIEAAAAEEETRIGKAPAPPPAKSGGDELFPPETSIILESLAAEEETRIGRLPHEPPPSDVTVSTEEFAPETKIMYITQPGQKVPEPEAAATRETDVYPVEASGDGQEVSAADTRRKTNDDDTRVFFKPSVPTWDDRGEKRKKLLMFIGGAVVVFAGIAAIIIIFLQAPK